MAIKDALTDFSYAKVNTSHMTLSWCLEYCWENSLEETEEAYTQRKLSILTKHNLSKPKITQNQSVLPLKGSAGPYLEKW